MSDKPKRARRDTDFFKQHYGGFCGWQSLADTFRTMEDMHTKIIFMGLFKLGCRAMELPTLTKRQVDVDFSPTQIMIRGMYVEKQKDRIALVDNEGNPLLNEDGKKTYTFVSKEGYRTFPIRKKEPLSAELIRYVNTFENDNDILFPYKYGKMYYKVAMVGAEEGSRDEWYKHKGEWWAHRLRSERACQLIRDYRYDTFRLKRFFGWASDSMPSVYSDIMPMDLVVEEDVNYR